MRPIEALISKVLAVRESYADQVRKQKSLRPEWVNYKDTRSTVFSRSAAILGDAGFCLINAARHMVAPQWWADNFSVSAKQEVCLRYAQGHERFAKFAFVLLFFSGIESSVRQIMRTLHPGKHSESTASFKAIYDDLLGELRITGYIPTLDLFREIRNVCHNNGVCFRPQGDVVRKYKGIDYRFRNNEKLDFVTWDLILDLVQGVLELLVDVVSDPVIAELGRIEDPFEEAAGSLLKLESPGKTKKV